MSIPAHYEGREQTYIKHQFLRSYLESVAYKTLSVYSDFVFVDGFSGPWRAKDEKYSDTSFGIALDKLRQVRAAWLSHGRDVRVRCVFIEKDQKAFRELQTAIASAPDIPVLAIHGMFEQCIPEIMRFIGRGFSLVFVDPTNWVVDTRAIGPLLSRRPGEVIFNFMFDFINRMVGNPDPQIQRQLSLLFADPNWRSLLRTDMPREEAIVDLFRGTLRKTGNFDYVIQTPILKVTADRPYFYLFYGTRHPKGLIAFRDVQRRVDGIQEKTRSTVKERKKRSQSQQLSLFGLGIPFSASQVTDRLAREEQAAHAQLLHLLSVNPAVRYEWVLQELLQRFVITESDLRRILLRSRAAGEIVIDGLSPPAKVPRKGHIIKHSI